MLAVEIVFWTCLFLVVYAYALYSACIWLLARSACSSAGPANDAADDLPRVTLLVAAHNEEQVIEEKILNSLRLDYPSDRLSIVIASDGSTDATPEIVSRYANQGIQLLNYRQRRGKSGLLNAAVAETNGEILVLSDANTEYEPIAIRKLVRWFADPGVNVVCGRLLLLDSQRGRNVDGIYWRYETFLKNCEGRLGALLGANGAIYAIRRRSYVPIPGNTIVDDLVIPLLSKLRHRGRIVFDPEAVASEETAPHIGSEFRRRVRIGTGAYQSVPLLWRLLNPALWLDGVCLSFAQDLAMDGSFFPAGPGHLQSLALGPGTLPGRTGGPGRRVCGSASGHVLPRRQACPASLSAPYHVRRHECGPLVRVLAVAGQSADRRPSRTAREAGIADSSPSGRGAGGGGPHGSGRWK